MTSCREQCGMCCDPVHMTGSKRQLLEVADSQPTPVEFRRWARRLIPIGTDGDGVHFTYACPSFDRQTRECRAYDERPWVCSAYPWYRDAPLAPADALGCMPASCSFLGDTLTAVAIGG